MGKCDRAWGRVAQRSSGKCDEVWRFLAKSLGQMQWCLAMLAQTLPRSLMVFGARLEQMIPRRLTRFKEEEEEEEEETKLHREPRL
jgi:hypothetical protein